MFIIMKANSSQGSEGTIHRKDHGFAHFCSISPCAVHYVCLILQNASVGGPKAEKLFIQNHSSQGSHVVRLFVALVRAQIIYLNCVKCVGG